MAPRQRKTYPARIGSHLLSTDSTLSLLPLLDLETGGDRPLIEPLSLVFMNGKGGVFHVFDFTGDARISRVNSSMTGVRHYFIASADRRICVGFQELNGVIWHARHVDGNTEMILPRSMVLG